MMGGQEPRIFVNLPSYRDPEIGPTLRDLFARAARPGRVFAGVCLQVDPVEDAACLVDASARPGQVRVAQVHHRESRGANWARAQAFGHWAGEEYVLSLDAHMRFEPGWDEALLEMHRQCPRAKAMLTGWVPGYHPLRGPAADDGRLPRLVIRDLGEPYESPYINLNRRPAAVPRGRMDPAPLCVGNCTFGPAAAFVEVPFDPYLPFWGSEFNLSVRLWTHGWDFFQFDRRVIYHYWDPEGIKDRSSYRDRRNPRHELARRRHRHLFGLERCDDPAMIAELDRYRLGPARPLEGYWRYLGVDFRGGTVAEFARRGEWTLPAAAAPAPAAPPPAPSPARGPGGHRPRKVFESPRAVVFDGFLPGDVYAQLRDHALVADYERVDARGPRGRGGHVEDGFPLRSTSTLLYGADGRPAPRGGAAPPAAPGVDAFVDRVLAVLPQVEHVVGRPGAGWGQVSVASWLYPQGTGRALHAGDAGAATGAFVYFLNPTWRPHWGGLLLLVDEEAARRVQGPPDPVGRAEARGRGWLHAGPGEEVMLESGLAECVFPKGNRIVFLAAAAPRMVTRVNGAAGDNHRMSLAGSFDRAGPRAVNWRSERS